LAPRLRTVLSMLALVLSLVLKLLLLVTASSIHAWAKTSYNIAKFSARILPSSLPWSIKKSLLKSYTKKMMRIAAEATNIVGLVRAFQSQAREQTKTHR